MARRRENDAVVQVRAHLEEAIEAAPQQQHLWRRLLRRRQPAG